MSHYTFFPWARPDLKHLPLDSGTPDLPVAARVPVELTVNDNAPIGLEAVLEGPGDVLGLDRGQIIRREPAPGTAQFESNYLVAVEFARPDLPWLFTPATADAQGRLRPWLVLVVLRKQPGVALLPAPDRLLRLEIKSPARPADELPDLTTSWAWAHAQLDDRLQPGETLDNVHSTRPARLGSRLLCPRRLSPNTRYIAALVPAFEAGRLAGLGLATAAVTTLAPAWQPNAVAVTLPVYDHWEFATGEAGDFESLLKLLLVPAVEPPAAEPAQRGRTIDARAADDGMPGGDEGVGTFTLECPLVPLGWKSSWEAGFGAQFAAALRPRLEAAVAGEEVKVTPPIYAALAANQEQVPPEAGEPHWLRELNLDPRFRVTAALGAEVIRRNEQRLVDAAWDQVGELREVNDLLRHVQAGVAAAAAVFRRHFAPLDDATFVQITRPMHSRVALNDQQTFHGLLTETRTTATFAAPEFVRAVRPRGPVVRHARAPAERTAARTTAVGGHWATILAVAFVRAPARFATLEAVEERFRAGGGTRTADAPPVTFAQVFSLPVASLPARPHFAVAAPALPTPFPVFSIFQPAADPNADTEAARRFRAALLKHQARLQPKLRIMTAPRPAFDLRKARGLLAERLQPSIQLAATARAMVQTENADVGRPNEHLNPLRLAPQFPEPLSAALNELSPELVVQGFEAVPNNSITVLETNPAFVEAFLAGANHEMARELVWREFPTDERATFFAHFWDSRSRDEGVRADITPIAEWKPERHLGGNVATGKLAVFLVRGELLRRYPTAVIYLVEAVWPAGQERPSLGSAELQPALRGAVGADAVYFGFAIDPAVVVAQPGWFFVVQEPPAEPRFGLEVDAPDAPLAPEGDAARTAKRYLQRPVRIAIHARDLLSHA